MPPTRGRKSRHITPTDTRKPTNQSSLTVKLSTLTVAALRTRLQEQNLPANRNKVAPIERLTHPSPSENSATVYSDPVPQQERSNSTVPYHEPLRG